MKRKRSRANKWGLACQVVSVLFLVWLLGGNAALAQTSYKDLTFPPLTFTPPQIERHTLSNGMKVFLVEDHELPVISMQALIRTGSVYEPGESIGLATVTAEVMRTGGTTTRRPDEINEILEYVAATVEVDINEETGTVDLWTLKKNLETSLNIFADILRRPAFDQEKVDLAKSQMLEILRRRNDSPQEIRSREFMRVVYGKMHPLARIPQPETIQNIQREALLAFHQRFFHPNNIMLAVTGDFVPEEILRQLEAVFQDWPAMELDVPVIPASEYHRAPAVYLVDKDVEQTNFALGHLGITADNPDYPAIRIMDLILGSGGFSSRLFQEVRNNRGLAYSVGSYLGAGIREYGVFTIFCGTRNDAVAEAITVIIDELKALTESEVSDRELDAAKNQYLNSYVFKFATVNDVIRRKMFYEYIGYPADFLETFRERVMNVTKADVIRVARKYLHPDQLIILAVGNASEIQDSLTAFGQVQELVLEPVE